MYNYYLLDTEKNVPDAVFISVEGEVEDKPRKSWSNASDTHETLLQPFHHKKYLHYFYVIISFFLSCNYKRSRL